MTLTELQHFLAQNDIRLTREGEYLRVNVPKGIRMDQVRALIQAHKESLLASLPLAAAPTPCSLDERSVHYYEVIIKDLEQLHQHYSAYGKEEITLALEDRLANACIAVDLDAMEAIHNTILETLALLASQG